MARRAIGAVAAALSIFPWAGIAAESAFAPGLAGFSVRVHGEVNPYRVLGVYVLPGETLRLEVIESAASFRIRSATGVARDTGSASWVWRAPESPGLYPLEIVSQESARRMTLNVFVMVPFDRVENGSINGYRIGSYPDRPLRGLAIYRRPRGFVEMTAEVERTPVSPHFELAQFQCKQADGPPQYVILQERLLLQLERVLAEVNARGYRSDTLTVMSGYRTPSYNAAIGNVPYSRHLWGDGADIFIDVDPQDGLMDDLDGNGRVDLGDAGVLYRIIDEMDGRDGSGQGGLARYPATASHGPFVHIDRRGFRARWGR